MSDGLADAAAIRERAAALGFDAVGIARVEPVAHQSSRLADFLAAGHHAGMDWMADRIGRPTAQTRAR